MGSVTMVMDAQTAKAVDGFLKVENAQKKVEERMAKIAAKSRSLDQVGGRLGKMKDKAGFASTALQGVATKLAGLATAAAAIGIVTGALAEMNAEAARGTRLLEEEQDTLKRLITLAASAGPGARERFKATAADISTGEGIELTRAENLVFQAVSFGKEKEVKEFAKMEAFTSPEAMLLSAFKFQKAFTEKEAGTNRQLINKFIAAAAPSETAPEVMAKAAIPAAQGASSIGATDEELLAIMAVTTGPFATPEETGTRAKAFTTIASQKGLNEGTGPGFAGAMRGFRNLSAEDQKKLLNMNVRSKDFILAYQKNEAEINRVEKEIIAAQEATGTPGSLINKAMAEAAADPHRAAARLTARGAQKLKAFELAAGVERSPTDAAVSKEMARGKVEGENFFGRAIRKGILNTARFVGAGPETIRRLSQTSLNLSDPRQPGGFRAALSEEELAERQRQFNAMGSRNAPAITEGMRQDSFDAGMPAIRINDTLGKLDNTLEKLDSTLTDKDQGQLRGVSD